MPSFLSRILFRPTIWIVATVVLVVVDLLAPAWLAIHVLALLMLPIAWRLLHRRHVPKLTALLMVAVVLPGAAHDIQRAMEQEAGRAAASRDVEQRHPWPFEPTRLWTFAGLAAAGLFHTNLQRDRRRRLTLRRELQRRVRRRTNQVRRANRALRSEVALRQETEHLLDRSENRFKALMDRMQLQVTRKNPDGVIIYANETFCRNLGVTAADVIGRTDADLFPPDLALTYRDDDLRVMRTGHAVDQVEEHPVLNGRPGFVQVFKAPEYDQEGQCTGVQIIFWDITQKHRAEMALRDSEARKRALFEAAGDAMLLVDAEGVIVEANPSAAELFHQSTAEMVGLPLQEVAQPVNPSPATTLEQARRHQRIHWDQLVKAKRHEMTLSRADGSRFEGEVTVHAIPVGADEGMAILVRDVTLRRRAFETLRSAKAAAEAANRTKTEFMAGVSHELRTPLGGITGLAELLANSELSNRDRQYVELIRHSATLLSDVIEDILDFAAIEAGRLQISHVPIDLYRVVAEAFECLSTRAGEKPLRLVLAIDPTTPRHVIADAKRIRQIVINLAGNAVKFTSHGEVQLRLSAETSVPRQPDPRQSVHDGRDSRSERTTRSTVPIMIEVIDTGIGIAPENQSRVFKAFERGEEGTTRVFGGTGLGLSISQKLARQMGGDITLTSRPGQGSTFRCRLALTVDRDAADSTPAATDAVQAAATASARETGPVLIDTDCAAMDTAFATTLRYHGIECRWGSDIQTALESRSTGQFFTWILSQTIGHQWSESISPHDRVVWVSRIGRILSPNANPDDPVLIEPVAPDELLDAISGKLGVSHGRPQWQGPVASGNLDSLPASPQGRVLLVDDSEVNRIVIRDLLTQAGFHVEVAADGKQAIAQVMAATDRLRSNPVDPSAAKGLAYDCILMDLQMPDMDGTTVACCIRKELYGRELRVPPIIALTAHVTEEHRRLCTEAGMEGFLTKPINPARLIAEIRRRIHSTSDEVTVDPPPRNLEEDQASKKQTNDTTEGTQWRRRMKAHGGDQPEIVVSLCEAFLAEVPTLVRQLRTAVTKQDAKRLRTAAHTLKSCLRYVADPADVKIAADIEAAAESPDQITSEQLERIDAVSARWIERVRVLRDEQQTVVSG